MVRRSKETILVIVLGFLALGLWFHRPSLLDAALVIGLAGVLSNYISDKIDWCWTKLSQMLGTISNTILLTLVFIVVVVPVGLLRRRRMSRFDASAASNFIKRDHPFSKKDLENTW
jgi:cbb3-type cytochrome oxidase subunit 3